MKLNDGILCDLCFCPSDTGESVCSCCKNTKITSNHKNGLLPQTVLNGKYITGKTLYYDNTCFGYLAYNMVENKRVMISELFPNHPGCTRREKNLHISSTDETFLNEMEKLSEQFKNSSEISYSLNNSGISLKICELFKENNTMYSVFEFPDDAKLLSDCIQPEHGIYESGYATKIIEKIITALESIHSGYLVHGNLRPENIVVCNEKILLTGFLFKKLNLQTESEFIQDSNPYAPLELFTTSGDVCPQTDIYSLGVIWYFMLTGEKIPTCFSRINSGDSYIPDNISSPEIKIIQKMIQLKITERYSNLSELVLDMKNNKISNIPVPKQNHVINGKAATEKKGKFSTKIIMIILACVIVCSAIACGAYIFITKNDGASTDKEFNNETSASSDSTIPSDAALEEETTSDAPAKVALPKEDDIKQEPEIVPPEPENPEVWNKNKMADFSEESKYVFGNETYKKDSIISVEFLSTLNSASVFAWDISENKDKSVMAWIKEEKNGSYKLFIGADGGINAGKSAKALFKDFKKVTSIQFNNCYHTDYSTSTEGMFKNCMKLKSLDLEGFSTKYITSSASMFENCFAMVELNIPKTFSTENVTDMHRMFDSCYKLKKLNVSMLDTSKVTDMSRMFLGCRSLEMITLANFDTSSVTDMTMMFYDCRNVTQINLQNCNVSSSVKTYKMFDKCKKLSKVITDSDIITRVFKTSEKE